MQTLIIIKFMKNLKKKNFPMQIVIFLKECQKILYLKNQKWKSQIIKKSFNLQRKPKVISKIIFRLKKRQLIYNEKFINIWENLMKKWGNFYSEFKI